MCVSHIMYVTVLSVLTPCENKLKKTSRLWHCFKLCLLQFEVAQAKSEAYDTCQMVLTKVCYLLPSNMVPPNMVGPACM